MGKNLEILELKNRAIIELKVRLKESIQINMDRQKDGKYRGVGKRHNMQLEYVTQLIAIPEREAKAIFKIRLRIFQNWLT